MTTKTKRLPFNERYQLAKHPLVKKILSIAIEKQSNLAHNPDVVASEQLLAIADAAGPSICLLKTHIDILEDFTPSVAEKLQQLAKKHQFLIFEDRKFVDIGSVVKQQYQGGIYKIADWADIVNANHIMPGSGVIQGLAEVGAKRGRGLLLLAEMSSKGALRGEAYRQSALEAAREHPDFVIGFICQKAISSDPGFLNITPGVQLAKKEDHLGQQYRTPYKAICEEGNDIVIVGRGIYQADNIQQAAEEYRDAAWTALHS